MYAIRSYYELNAEREHLEEKLAEQKQTLEDLQKKFAAEFENLANRIFEEKTQKFTDQNKTNLDDVLKPLSEKIKDFEKKVNDIYVTDSKERAAISEQIKQLHELNQQMSKEANNLTKALKGDSKTQGNWGEFILETILEKSGLDVITSYSIHYTKLYDKSFSSLIEELVLLFYNSFHNLKQSFSPLLY